MKDKPIFLHSSISDLNFVGAKREVLLREVGINSVKDILDYIPRKYYDRRDFTELGSLTSGDYYKVKGEVFDTNEIPRRLFSVTIKDETGYLTASWFGGGRFIKGKFNKGDSVVFAGEVSTYKEELQMSHPDYIIIKEASDKEKFKGFFPVYPSSERLKKGKIENNLLIKIINDALERLVAPKQEIIPQALLDNRFFPPIKEVYSSIHRPMEKHELALIERLKYEELFLFLYKLRYYRENRNEKGFAFNECYASIDQCLRGLGFELTGAQKRVLKEIKGDMMSSKRMCRLIQGDVGSGKTVLAAVAALIAKKSNKQSALMVPTEILARQHYKTFHDIFESLGYHTVFLCGSLSKKDRAIVEEQIENGSADIIIGTHAAISKSVTYRNLGLVIIDEQHRFGVDQRLKLFTKGQNPDMLVMSATPIPRTLAHMLYGDLDISIIDELPPGRKPVKTFCIPEFKREGMYEFIKNKIIEMDQAFFLFPLIDETETSQAKALKGGFKEIEQVFHGVPAGFVHGKQDSEERDEILNEFKIGNYKILAATTVIEVGVDIPNASIMVIENCERFGLSQLHQLRGRIGRGTKEAYCFLMSGGDLSETSLTRLKAFCSTTDGFKIAKLDYQARGPGEITGSKQSGIPQFKFLDVINETEFILEVKKDVEDIFGGRYDLSEDQKAVLENYLYESESEDLKFLSS